MAALRHKFYSLPLIIKGVNGMEDYIATDIVYVVSHNGNDVYHFTKLLSGNQITTGLPFMQIFLTPEEAIAVFHDNISLESVE
jgi:hypothetical protein